MAVALLQRKEINILKRVSFNRNVVQFYGFCLEEQAPMLVRSIERARELGHLTLFDNLTTLHADSLPSSVDQHHEHCFTKLSQAHLSLSASF